MDAQIDWYTSPTIPVFSRSMRFFLAIKLPRLAWSLRRLYVPVSSSDLVLEVGSGGNPYGRSDVLVDAYENTDDRHWVPLVSDRPTALAYGECLPFKDKAFDFVIASHVLEHSAHPEKFLTELQRVAKAGYIEVPHAFFEKVNPYHNHRLEIGLEESELIISKKSSAIPDPDLVEAYKGGIQGLFTETIFRHHPFHFHVRYYWRGNIKWRITNPSTAADWEIQRIDQSLNNRQSILAKMKKFVLNLLSACQKLGNKIKVRDILDLVVCPTCHRDLIKYDDKLVCHVCHINYLIHNGKPNFCIGHVDAVSR